MTVYLLRNKTATKSVENKTLFYRGIIFMSFRMGVTKSRCCSRYKGTATLEICHSCSDKKEDDCLFVPLRAYILPFFK